MILTAFGGIQQFAGPNFEARHNLSSDDLLEVSKQLSGMRYHPILINGYSVAGEPLFAAIFEQ